MNNEINSVCQAKDLLMRLSNASAVFKNGHDEIKHMITESEVIFRYESISGIFAMLWNDIYGLVKTWEKEEALAKARGEGDKQ